LTHTQTPLTTAPCTKKPIKSFRIKKEIVQSQEYLGSSNMDDLYVFYFHLPNIPENFRMIHPTPNPIKYPKLDGQSVNKKKTRRS
jgi:hypothetical protein